MKKIAQTTKIKNAINKWGPVFEKLYRIDELVKEVYEKDTALVLSKIIFTPRITDIVNNDKYKCFLNLNSLFSFIELKENSHTLRSLLKKDLLGFRYDQFEKAVDKLNNFFIEKDLGDFTKYPEWNTRMIECARYRAQQKCMSSQGKYLKEIREKLDLFKLELTNDPSLIWKLEIKSSMGVLRCEEKVPFVPLNKSILKDKSESPLKS